MATTIGELEEIIINHLIDIVSRGERIPSDILEEALEMGLELPDFLTNNANRCTATCKSGKRCESTTVLGSETCRRHEPNRPPRTGQKCEIEECKSFVGKWAPLCFVHAKQRGLIPPPVEKGECPICYSNVNSNNEMVLKCDHTFHKKCLVSWFGAQRTKGLETTCPVCRHGH